MTRRWSRYWECKQCGHKFESKIGQCPVCKGIIIKDKLKLVEEGKIVRKFMEKYGKEWQKLGEE